MELVERIFVDTQKDFFVWLIPSYICKRKSPTAVGKLFNGVVVNGKLKEIYGENGISKKWNEEINLVLKLI